jgi:hypothetical protein
MPVPSATTSPVVRSMTEIWPRTNDRMPSSVQKNAPKLGSSSILNFASRAARSVIELEATTSSQRVLINAARSWVGGSSNTKEVGPDSTTHSPGVYVARHRPNTADIDPPQSPYPPRLPRDILSWP